MNNYGVFLETAVEAAKAAGAIQKDNFGKKHDVRLKGEADLVTEVDVACEKAIGEIILSRWPSHAILGEEGGATGESDYLWIVDPLDGTTNYAHHYPHFCSSVAIEHRDVIVAGAVYDPMRDELFTAARGQGASLNGGRLVVSNRDSLKESMLTTGFPYDAETRVTEALPLFAAVQSEVQAVRRDGSAALNMCYVASGRFDGFWEISLHAWDVAAGWIIVEEAGGKVTGMDGKPTDIHSGNILASNSLIHEAIEKILTGARIKK